MSNVSLSIGGRDYAVACAAGEEDHVRGLGALIDGKLRDMGGAGGQSESRQLLFASLLLADELHELKHRGGGAAPAQAASANQASHERLEAIAANLEKIAAHLEG